MKNTKITERIPYPDYIDRNEDLALVRRYDGEFPERFADEIFKYLSIFPDEFPQASKCLSSR